MVLHVLTLVYTRNNSLPRLTDILQPGGDGHAGVQRSEAEQRCEGDGEGGGGGFHQSQVASLSYSHCS